MSRTKPVFHVATALIGLALSAGQCMAQDCTGCGTASSPVSLSSAGDSTACDSCGRVGCRLKHNGEHPRIDEFKAKWEHHQALNAKITARNDAWPKPFNCADRQLYFALWEPMIDQGFQEQCVLMSVHFDPETQELNQFGKHTVAGIMQNMPSHRKEVFIHREGNDDVNDARRANVVSLIDMFYGQTGPARVAFSSQIPIAIRGPRADVITQMSIEGMQTPVIPISSGESVSSSVGN